MHSSGSDGVHFGLRDVSCHNRDSILPDKQFLIIRTADELVFFNKSQCVNCSQMLCVLHGLLASAQVELEDFLLIRPTEKYIWVVLGRMVLED
jgi:hypothetical protein